MLKREIPVTPYQNENKNKILDTATKLFSLRGFHSVTTQDIAKVVGVRSSALYNHYKSKEEIMDDILSRFEKGYRSYIEWQTSRLAEAQSLDEVMDILFNEEFLEVQDPTSHYGISFIVKEQHEFESARKLMFDLFHEFTVKRLHDDLSRLIARGVIPPSDTEPIARMFMYHVLAGNDMRVHELAGVKPPVDCKEMYEKLKVMMRTLLKAGISG